MALTKVTSDGITDGTIIGTDLATNVDLVDNKKIRFGTGNDLEIFHDSSHSRINNSTGNLAIANSADLISIDASNRIDISDDFIRLRSRDGSDVYMTGTVNSSVDLYFDGSKKFETTSSGATVTGSLGIGTTSPSGKLHVEHSGELNSYFVGNTSTSGSRIILWNKNTTANSFTGVLGADAGGQTTASINFYSANNDTNEGYLTLETRPSGGLPAERMRIDSSGRVGINETALSSFNSIGDDLVISQASGSAGITIRSGATNTGVLAFTDGANTSFRGDLRYDHNGDYMRFTTNGDERMRIDSSGNVAIGTSTIANESDHKKLVISGASGSGAGIIEFADGSDNIDGAIFSDDGNLFIVADRDNATSSSSIRFRVDGSSEKMRIDSSGRVMIGTTTEGESSADDLTVATSGTTGITIRSGTANTGNIFFSDGTSGNDEFKGYVQYHHDGNYMRFATDNTERVRIDSSGRVLIGVNASYANAAADNLQVGNNNSSDPSGITLGSTANSSIRFSDAGNGTDGWVLYNHADTSLRFGANNAERMRIDASGRVLVGTTSSGGQQGVSIVPNNSNGACTLLFDRANTSNTSTVLNFENNNSTVGSITHGNSSTAYNTSSDYRLKENTVAISDGISRLKTLKPYRFNFKIEPSRTVDGFFAHEVTAVPEAITGTKDEVDSDNNPVYQGIDQSKLVPLLTAALQEVISKIEILETEVAALKAG